MQYLDAHPAWGLGKMAREKGMAQELNYYFEQVSKTIPNIQRLLEACRGVGIEVIYTRIASLTRDSRDASLALRVRDLATPPGTKEAEILEELSPAGDDLIISKTSSGIFNSTAIDQIFRNLGTKYLIVTGVVTNHCVELSVRDAADRGYYVIVVSDGCASFTEELHQQALQRMSTGLMKVKTTEEVLTLISRAPQAQGRRVGA
jgi:nicotinamidase-related amidase